MLARGYLPRFIYPTTSLFQVSGISSNFTQNLAVKRAETQHVLPLLCEMRFERCETRASHVEEASTSLDMAWAKFHRWCPNDMSPELVKLHGCRMVLRRLVDLDYWGRLGVDGILLKAIDKLSGTGASSS